MDWTALCTSNMLFVGLVLDFVEALEDASAPQPQLSAGDTFSIQFVENFVRGGAVIAAANGGVQIEFGGQRWLLRPRRPGDLVSGIQIDMRRRTWIVEREL